MEADNSPSQDQRRAAARTTAATSPDGCGTREQACRPCGSRQALGAVRSPVDDTPEEAARHGTEQTPEGRLTGAPFTAAEQCRNIVRAQHIDGRTKRHRRG